MEKVKMSKLKAIRNYFEADGGRKVTLSELKALTTEDKDELAPLAAAELGVELTETPA
jgi:hypothetical protein